MYLIQEWAARVRTGWALKSIEEQENELDERQLKLQRRRMEDEIYHQIGLKPKAPKTIALQHLQVARIETQRQKLRQMADRVETARDSVALAPVYRSVSSALDLGTVVSGQKETVDSLKQGLDRQHAEQKKIDEALEQALDSVQTDEERETVRAVERAVEDDSIQALEDELAHARPLSVSRSLARQR